MSIRSMIVLVLTVAAVGAAQAIDPTTFRCEDKAAAAIGNWGADRARCIAQCEVEYWADLERQGSTTRSCRGPVGVDLDTLRCFHRTDGRLRRRVAAACGRTVLPTCGPWDGVTDLSLAQSVIDSGDMQRFYVLNALVCAYPDASDLRAEAKVVAAVGQFARDLRKCYASCFRAQKLHGDATRLCVPPDGPTSDCIALGRTRLFTRVRSATAAPPFCGSYPYGVPAFAANAEVIGTSPSSWYCGSPSGAFVD